ncbi:D-alanyl-D-alanine carboxypeptidase [Cytobacillus spongiae]|jgi:D-alanyl-D-alanine carboxypeptidase|uniref:D-alanyl-D-alanine carboxypeptidase family protein n=1 Tax=Cytobacillus spongiae TaxID=2901381 RepID=UPI001F37E56C|nr:D-alanyl-D-alanine carboxypeptidase family protein [Cytobacillus spongiae]UII54692.1 D-alanyl-D-alanine carboxypeptidase [Cytobacillus spongiae]
MKLKLKWLISSLTVSLLFLLLPENTKAISVSARGAVLIEQESGRILYEKEANTKMRIASITKIMTAIIAIESGKMDEMVKVSEKAVRTEGSSVYLKPGEKIKLEDLVYGLMLRSGNDAAVAIAEHVGGSLDGFVYLMNQKANEIGMSNTHFANPHGLDDHENHLSTAFDMALLTRYAMENEVYQRISGTEVHKAPNPTEKWDRVWKNKNRLLTQLYDYCTGGKTGYTKRAKRTLVSTASKEEMNLIAVTLNAPDDWNDHIAMYESAFKTYDMAEILEEGDLSVEVDDFYQDKLIIKQPYVYPVKGDERELFRVEYKLQKPQDDWEDGKEVPTVVGRAIIYLDEKPIHQSSIYFKQEFIKEEKSFFDFFKGIFSSIIGVKSYG